MQLPGWMRGSDPPLLPQAPIRVADAFVGREAVLELLDAALAQAHAGSGRGALICGDEGIGKTRLLRRFAELASARGVHVLFAAAACEPGAPAFWPWVQVLRALATAGLASRDELCPLLTALDPARSGRARPDSDDAPCEPAPHAQASRFWTIDTLSQLLFAVARRAPLCIVLDDLHDADPSSCALLRHLLRELHAAPLFVLFALRDDGEPSARSAAERAALVQAAEPVVRLEGLTCDDVRALLAERLGDRAARGLVQAVHARTEGNPLYVSALLPALASAGPAADGAAPIELPRSLRLALGARLAALPAACRDSLGAAAVLGRDLDVALLAQVTGQCRDVLAGQLELARAEGVLRRNPEPSPCPRYAFAHALLCELLAGELDAGQRARLHQRAVAVLRSAAVGGDPHGTLLRLAHHGLGCGTADGEALALSAARRASDAAAAGNAHEQLAAALCLELAALAAGERRSQHAGEPDAGGHRVARQRASLLQRCAGALWRTGEHDAARARLAELIELARSLGDAELLAQAALAAIGSDIGLQLNEAQIALGEQALSALPERSRAARVQLLAGLGMRLCFSPEKARGVALVREAEALAAQIGALDHETERALLNGRHYAFPAGGSLADNMAITERVAVLAPYESQPDLALHAMHWGFMHCLEQGHVAEAERRLRRFCEAARRWGDPLQIWLTLIDRCNLAMLRGQLVEAEQLARLGFATGQRAQSPNARVNMLAQCLAIRRLQGRSDELVDHLAAGAERMAHVPEFRAAMAAIYAEVGRRDEAAAELERACGELALRDVCEVSPYALCMLAECAAALGDASRAAMLHGRLLPFAERFALIATGQTCDGSVWHYLGLAARAAGESEQACRAFERALRANAMAGAAPALARSKHELAALLAADPQQRARAQGLAEQALAAFERIGMRSWSERARALLAQLAQLTSEPLAPAAVTASPSAAPPAPLEPATAVPAGTAVPVLVARAEPEAAFAREGEYWSLSFAGQCIRLRDSKGLRYLGALLDHAGSDLHVLELIARVDGVAQAGAVEHDGLTVSQHAREWDAPLDGECLRAYRQRATALRETLAEAELLRDVGRMQRAQEELGSLEHELAGQLRMRHRPTERARKAVYNRIRQAIARIAHEHAPLGRHLDHCVRTGTHCGYHADPVVRWRT